MARELGAGASVWVSTLDKAEVVRSYPSSSWLLSQPRTCRGDHVLLLVYLQNPCAAISVTSLSLIADSEPKMVVGMMRQSSYGGSSTAPLPSPGLTRGLSHSNKSLGDLASVQTLVGKVEQLSANKADLSGQSWWIQVPLPGSLDAGATWGNEPELLDPATLVLTLQLRSSENLREDTDIVLQTLFDPSCPCSCVSLCMIIKSKCSGLQPWSAFLKSLQASKNVLHVNDESELYSSFWFYGLVALLVKTFPSYVTVPSYSEAIVAFTDILTTDLGGAYISTQLVPLHPMVAMMSLCAVEQLRTLLPSHGQSKIPAIVYRLPQVLVHGQGSKRWRTLTSLGSSSLPQHCIKHAVVSCIGYLALSESRYLFPTFQACSACLPLAMELNATKDHVMYARIGDGGLLNSLSELKQEYQGVKSRFLWNKRPKVLYPTDTDARFLLDHSERMLTRTNNFMRRMGEYMNEITEDQDWKCLVAEYKLHVEVDRMEQFTPVAQTEFGLAADVLRNVVGLTTDLVTNSRARLTTRLELLQQNALGELCTPDDIACHEMSQFQYVVTVFAGCGELGLNLQPMDALQCPFRQPSDVMIHSGGAMFVCDTGNSRICSISNTNEKTNQNAGQVPEDTWSFGTCVTTNGPENGPVQGHSVGTREQTLYSRPSSCCEMRGVDGAQYILVTDTNNHCLKLVDPTTWVSRVFAGSPTNGGFNDGDLNTCLFKFPSHVAPGWKPNSYVVCDKGNHSLRLIEYQKKKTVELWKVTTLVGGPNAKGSRDGNFSTAQLNGPTAAVTHDKVIYFVEQNNKSIRAVHTHSGILGGGQKVETLFQGAPLKNPSGLCMGRPGQLIVTDTDGVVWSFSITNRRLEALVTKRELLTILPYETNTDGPREIRRRVNDQFAPSGIKSIEPGLYLVADQKGHRILRIMDREFSASARERYEREVSAQIGEANLCEGAWREFDRLLTCTLQTLRSQIGILGFIRSEILRAHFLNESLYLQTVTESGLLRHETLECLIDAVPDFECLSNLFTTFSIPESLLPDVRLKLLALIRRCSISSPCTNATRELMALTRLLRVHSFGIIDLEFLSELIIKDDFEVPVTEPSVLTMLQHVLTLVGYKLDVSSAGGLRRALNRWLSRVVGNWTLANFEQEDIMRHVLLRWSECIANVIQSNGDGFNDVLKCLSQAHLESKMLGNDSQTIIIEGRDGQPEETTRVVDRSQTTLLNSPLLSLLDLHPLVSDVLVNVYSNAAILSHIKDVVPALLRPPEQYQNCNKTRLNVLIQRALCGLIHTNLSSIQENLIEQAKIRKDAQAKRRFQDVQAKRRQNGEAVDDLRMEDFFDENPPVITDSEIRVALLKTDPVLWSRAVHFTFSNTYARIRIASTADWPYLLERCTQLREWFEIFETEFMSGQLTVEIFKRVVSYHESLSWVWQTISSKLQRREMLQHHDTKLQEALKEVNVLQTILAKFMPESEEFAKIQTALHRWNSSRVCEIKHFLRLESVSDSRLQALPSDLLSALDWLHFLMQSSAFVKLWESQDVELSSARIVPAAQQWQQLYVQFKSQQLTLGGLGEYVSHFSLYKEIEMLSQTAPGFKNEARTFKIVSASTTGVRQLHELVSKWEHISCIRRQRDKLHLVLALVPSFVVESAIHQIRNVEAALTRMLTTLDSCDWDSIPISDINRFWSNGKDVDNRLFRVEPDLLTIIHSKSLAIDWLRSMKNDQNFTSGIEMALGKTEMECPIEMWDTENGRVDEQKLSMLRNVRSYLHRFLYEAPIFSDFEAFLDVFGKMNDSVDPQVIMKNIEMIETNLIPIKDIMSDSAETAAPNRLWQLYQPQKEAVWVCFKDASVEGSKNAIRLEYQVVDKTAGIVRVQNHSLDELLDFQCNVVLARTSERNSVHVQAIIDKFLEQFGWVRKVGEALKALQDGGHFDFYPHYKESYHVTVEPEFIKQRAFDLELKLKSWQAAIISLRDQFYFANFLTIKQLRVMASLLDSESVSAASFAEFFCFINGDGAHDDGRLQAFSSSLRSSWERSQLLVKPQLPDPAVGRLEAIVEAVHEASKDVTPRTRGIGQVTLEDDPFVEVTRGVHVVLAPTLPEEFLLLLTCHIHLGWLPEWAEVLVCNANTSEEDLSNFIRRWCYASRYNRAGRFFFLAGVTEVSFELQNRASMLIREKAGDATVPLILVSNSSSSSYLITQYSHNKLNVFPIHESVARVIGEALSEQYSQSVTVHKSAVAGAGKTFNIRTAAHKTNRIYVHVPINIDMSKALLIRRITTSIKIASSTDQHGLMGIYLHLDVAGTTVSPKFNAVAFELCYLGLISDEDSGKSFTWDPRTSSIGIELASGGLWDNLPLCWTLACQIAVASSATFVSSSRDLEAGMGEEFHSARNDGTVDQAQDLSIVRSSAHRRLQYVCHALYTMRENNDNFPYLFDMAGKEDLSGDLCYDLLSAASHLEAKPSLWCLWNFVNVLYWQICDLHHPESPLNTACMPDHQSHVGNEVASKMRMKGEILLFIIRTAREFATRQIRVVDADRIISVTITGLSRVNFNGVWTRALYDNDGQPCFEKAQRRYYLYYRKAPNERRWVIDDLIEVTGPVYSCNNSIDMTTGWSTSPSWAPNPAVRAEQISMPDGYKAEAIRITGCASTNKGGSVSANEDGVYLRQPPYDDINGKAHYMKDGENRRHLFWASEGNKWQICPVCNEDQGAFAMTTSSEIRGPWETIPPDIVESKVKFQFRYARDQNAVANQVVHEDSSFGMLPVDLLKWQDSNHECVLFSNEQHVARFLSMNPAEMKSRMHPNLVNHLERNNITVGEDLRNMAGQYPDLLRDLTGVTKDIEEARTLMGGNYCLTGDSVMKMLAIVYRIRCGIPVVLMGECGCGKTMLISFMCTWLGVQLLVLDVHGGTSEQDIVGVFTRAEGRLAAVTGGNASVYVFLDEVNTCQHMGLINEVVCHRSLNGRRIPDAIQILAALNPYRLRQKQVQEGLTFTLGAKSSTPDPMSRLVYRVTPVPETMQDYIFDFGALEDATELLYVKSMISGQFPEWALTVKEIVADLITASHVYIREYEQDSSAVSLRDVKRVLILTRWFLDTSKAPSENTKAKLAPHIRAMVLALAHVYCYRLSAMGSRQSYWIRMQYRIKNWGKQAANAGFGDLEVPGKLQAVVERAQRKFADNLQIEDGIAMNQALMENLFVVIICILNRIPCFVVGKPGTSKTLTMQVIASNLQGEQSPKQLWRKYPAVYMFQYQCSPLSTSSSIKFQFDAAVSYQKHSQDVITILLLDEVGLAEHSPDMPLKVLHAMLVDPPIAIVGLSNWVLDPAKMNRAVCLQRPEPSEDDILLTGAEIVQDSGPSIITSQNEDSVSPPTEPAMPASLQRQPSANSRLNEWLQAVAQAFHQIYHGGEGRDFIGMRDYYQLLKLLRNELRSRAGQLDSDLLTTCICRNFGGKAELINKVLKVFHQCCFDQTAESFQIPSVLDLIQSNLMSSACRHLMLLTRNDAALSLLTGCGILKESEVDVLIGSRFKDDLAELHLIQQINQVKQAMATGRTVVLLNHDNIYEALYDVLNQRYVMRVDQDTGIEKKMLRLAIGPRSQLCPVASGFKIVVIVEQTHAYHQLDLPLLNRFEKQILTAQDVLNSQQQDLEQRLRQWIMEVHSQTSLKSIEQVICGYHSGILASLALYLTDYGRRSGISPDHLFDQGVRTLARMALPVAMLNSSLLSQVDGLDYFTEQANLVSYVSWITRADPANLVTLLTFSSVLHFEEAIRSQQMRSTGFENAFQVLHLAELSSEKHLVRLVSEFFRSPNAEVKFLSILCDPVTCPAALIGHARYICVQQYYICQQERTLDSTKKLMIVVHLPPGIANRERDFAMDFYQPWSYTFVDDLRPESVIEGPSLLPLLQNSIFDLTFAMRIIPWSTITIREIQSSLVRCITPEIDTCLQVDHSEHNAYDLHRFSTRSVMVRRLMEQEGFQLILEQGLSVCLKNASTQQNGMHKHVAMACLDDLQIGTLRQSLNMAITSVISQSVSHILRQLDKNFALSRLWLAVRCDNDSATRLWLQSCAKIMDWTTLGSTCTIVQPSELSSIDASVPNTSQHAPLMCQFPFSDKLVHILNNKETRERLEQAKADNPIDTCTALLVTLEGILGKEILDLWSEVFKDDHTAYLFDFVAIATHPFPGVTFNVHFQLIQSMLRFAMPSVLSSPASIHSAYWYVESRILGTLSILSSAITTFSSHSKRTYANPRLSQSLNIISLELSAGIAQSLRENTPHQSNINCKLNRFLMSFVLFQHIMKSFQHSIVECTRVVESELSSPVMEVNVFSNLLCLLEGWYDIFSAVYQDIETLLMMVLNDSNASTEIILNDSSASIDVMEVLRLWWKCSLAKIIIQEAHLSHTEVDVRDLNSLLSEVLKEESGGPYSSDGLDLFIQALGKLTSVDTCTHPFWGYTIRRYVDTIMLKEHIRIRGTPFSSQFKPHQLEILIKLAHADPQLIPARILNNSNSGWFYGSNALRRTIVQFVWMLEDTDIEAMRSTDCRKRLLQNVQTAQVLNQWRQDLGLSRDLTPFGFLRPKELSFDTIVEIVSTTDPIASFSEAHDTLQFVDALFLARRSLEEYAYTLSACLIDTAESDQVLSQPTGLARALIHDERNAVIDRTDLSTVWREDPKFMPQIYTLKLVKNLSGIESVFHYFAREQVPFLPQGCQLLSPRDREFFKTIDPFPGLVTVEAYHDMCRAVRSYVLGGGPQQLMVLRDNSASTIFDKLAIAATFTQTVIGREQLNVSNVKLLFMFLLNDLKVSGPQKSVYQWVLSNCPVTRSNESSIRTVICEENPAADFVNVPLHPTALLQAQVTTHALSIAATSKSDSWLGQLFYSPKDFNTRFVPTMLDDEFMAIVSASGGVGWYVCQNGHPFTVGNCTWPMESRKCNVTGCGAVIGGNNHVPAAGVRRLEQSDLNKPIKPGYDNSCTMGEKAYDLQVQSRSSVIGCQALRFIMHSVMLVSAVTASADTDSHIGYLFFPTSTHPSLDRTCEELEKRRQHDWDALLTSTGLLPADLALSLHLILERWGQMPNKADSVDNFTTPSGRNEFEVVFLRDIQDPVLTSAESRNLLQQAKEKYAGESRSNLLNRALGYTFGHVDESIISGDTEIVQRLWRVREPATFDVMKRWFFMQKQNETMFPLLSAILKEEERLPSIKYIADILAWHNVLFRAFGRNSISREEATNLSNVQVIERLPESDRSQAREVLTRYCEGFNASFGIVTLLYECNPNPFLNQQGEVDLSGTGRGSVKMTEETPVSFSLPSLLHGDNDATGMCTVRLISELQDSHNQVLQTLRKFSVEAEDSPKMQILDDEDFVPRIQRKQQAAQKAARSALQREQINRSVAAVVTPNGAEEKKGDDVAPAKAPKQAGRAVHGGGDDLACLPVTTHLTPHYILRRRLLDYNREVHMLPLVSTYAIQSLQPGKGFVRGFDFARIQDGLAEQLLSSATPITVHVMQFQFAGELRRTVGLTELNNRVPQSELSQTILEGLWTEIDTRYRLVCLIAIVEECIAFVLAAAKQGDFEPNMKLERCILQAMCVEEVRWSNVSCPSLIQHVRLMHLQSLFVNLEEKLNGDPLDSVALTYKEELTSSLERQLRDMYSTAMPAVPKDDVLLNLRELMLQQLCTGTQPGNASLAEYLFYLTGDENFLACLPEEMQLRHAYRTYQLLKRSV